MIEHLCALMRAQNALLKTQLHGVGDELGHPQSHLEAQLELLFDERPPF